MASWKRRWRRGLEADGWAARCEVGSDVVHVGQSVVAEAPKVESDIAVSTVQLGEVLRTGTRETTIGADRMKGAATFESPVRIERWYPGNVSGRCGRSGRVELRGRQRKRADGRGKGRGE
eukprot:TRINITY_DN11720_c0_g1_i11.p1 TRINITY_DN11720_c0_g1~~TRINITY_DN11720_c0_g1_i11.p1  ORF type:complete len:120 (-),score=11.85 TRINITY_DN11720_c0_g1_i11:170-529(-)